MEAPPGGDGVPPQMPESNNPSISYASLTTMPQGSPIVTVDPVPYAYNYPQGELLQLQPTQSAFIPCTATFVGMAQPQPLAPFSPQPISHSEYQQQQLNINSPYNRTPSQFHSNIDSPIRIQTSVSAFSAVNSSSPLPGIGTVLSPSPRSRPQSHISISSEPETMALQRQQRDHSDSSSATGSNPSPVSLQKGNNVDSTSSSAAVSNDVSPNDSHVTSSRQQEEEDGQDNDVITFTSSAQHIQCESCSNMHANATQAARNVMNMSRRMANYQQKIEENEHLKHQLAETNLFVESSVVKQQDMEEKINALTMELDQAKMKISHFDRIKEVLEAKANEAQGHCEAANTWRAKYDRGSEILKQVQEKRNKMQIDLNKSLELNQKQRKIIDGNAKTHEDTQAKLTETTTVLASYKKYTPMLYSVFREAYKKNPNQWQTFNKNNAQKLLKPETMLLIGVEKGDAPSSSSRPHPQNDENEEDNDSDADAEALENLMANDTEPHQNQRSREIVSDSDKEDEDDVEEEELGVQRTRTGRLARRAKGEREVQVTPAPTAIYRGNRGRGRGGRGRGNWSAQPSTSSGGYHHRSEKYVDPAELDRAHEQALLQKLKKNDEEEPVTASTSTTKQAETMKHNTIHGKKGMSIREIQASQMKGPTVKERVAAMKARDANKTSSSSNVATKNKNNDNDNNTFDMDNTREEPYPPGPMDMSSADEQMTEDEMPENPPRLSLSPVKKITLSPVKKIIKSDEATSSKSPEKPKMRLLFSHSHASADLTMSPSPSPTSSPIKDPFASLADQSMGQEEVQQNREHSNPIPFNSKEGDNEAMPMITEEEERVADSAVKEDKQKEPEEKEADSNKDEEMPIEAEATIDEDIRHEPIVNVDGEKSSHVVPSTEEEEAIESNTEVDSVPTDTPPAQSSAATSADVNGSSKSSTSRIPEVASRVLLPEYNPAAVQNRHSVVSQLKRMTVLAKPISPLPSSVVLDPVPNKNASRLSSKTQVTPVRKQKEETKMMSATIEQMPLPTGNTEDNVDADITLNEKLNQPVVASSLAPPPSNADAEEPADDATVSPPENTADTDDDAQMTRGIADDERIALELQESLKPQTRTRRRISDITEKSASVSPKALVKKSTNVPKSSPLDVKNVLKTNQIDQKSITLPVSAVTSTKAMPSTSKSTIAAASSDDDDMIGSILSGAHMVGKVKQEVMDEVDDLPPGAEAVDTTVSPSPRNKPVLRRSRSQRSSGVAASVAQATTSTPRVTRAGTQAATRAISPCSSVISSASSTRSSARLRIAKEASSASKTSPKTPIATTPTQSTRRSLSQSLPQLPTKITPVARKAESAGDAAKQIQQNAEEEREDEPTTQPIKRYPTRPIKKTYVPSNDETTATPQREVEAARVVEAAATPSARAQIDSDSASSSAAQDISSNDRQTRASSVPMPPENNTQDDQAGMITPTARKATSAPEAQDISTETPTAVKRRAGRPPGSLNKPKPSPAPGKKTSLINSPAVNPVVNTPPLITRQSGNRRSLESPASTTSIGAQRSRSSVREDVRVNPNQTIDFVPRVTRRSSRASLDSPTPEPSPSIGVETRGRRGSMNNNRMLSQTMHNLPAPIDEPKIVPEKASSTVANEIPAVTRTAIKRPLEKSAVNASINLMNSATAHVRRALTISREDLRLMVCSDDESAAESTIEDANMNGPPVRKRDRMGPSAPKKRREEDLDDGPPVLEPIIKLNFVAAADMEEEEPTVNNGRKRVARVSNATPAPKRQMTTPPPALLPNNASTDDDDDDNLSLADISKSRRLSLVGGTKRTPTATIAAASTSKTPAKGSLESAQRVTSAGGSVYSQMNQKLEQLKKISQGRLRGRPAPVPAAETAKVKTASITPRKMARSYSVAPGERKTEAKPLPLPTRSKDILNSTIDSTPKRDRYSRRSAGLNPSHTHALADMVTLGKPADDASASTSIKTDKNSVIGYLKDAFELVTAQGEKAGEGLVDRVLSNMDQEKRAAIENLDIMDYAATMAASTLHMTSIDSWQVVLHHHRAKNSSRAVIIQEEYFMEFAHLLWAHPSVDLWLPYVRKMINMLLGQSTMDEKKCCRAVRMIGNALQFSTGVELEEKKRIMKGFIQTLLYNFKLVAARSIVFVLMSEKTCELLDWMPSEAHFLQILSMEIRHQEREVLQWIWKEQFPGTPLDLPDNPSSAFGWWKDGIEQIQSMARDSDAVYINKDEDIMCSDELQKKIYATMKYLDPRFTNPERCSWFDELLKQAMAYLKDAVPIPKEETAQLGGLYASTIAQKSNELLNNEVLKCAALFHMVLLMFVQFINEGDHALRKAVGQLMSDRLDEIHILYKGLQSEDLPDNDAKHLALTCLKRMLNGLQPYSYLAIKLTDEDDDDEKTSNNDTTDTVAVV